MSFRNVRRLGRWTVSTAALAAAGWLTASSAGAGVTVVTFDSPNAERGLRQNFVASSQSAGAQAGMAGGLQGPQLHASPSGGAGGGGGGAGGGGSSSGSGYSRGGSGNTSSGNGGTGNGGYNQPQGPNAGPGGNQGVGNGNAGNGGGYPDLPSTGGGQGPVPPQASNAGDPGTPDIDFGNPQTSIDPALDDQNNSAPQPVVAPGAPGAAATDTPELSSMLTWLGVALAGAYGAKRRRQK